MPRRFSVAAASRVARCCGSPNTHRTLPSRTDSFGRCDASRPRSSLIVDYDLNVHFTIVRRCVISIDDLDPHRQRRPIDGNVEREQLVEIERTQDTALCEAAAFVDVDGPHLHTIDAYAREYVETREGAVGSD